MSKNVKKTAVVLLILVVVIGLASFGLYSTVTQPGMLPETNKYIGG